MCKAEEICEKPFVVIQCLAYNHQPYIRQCLDGFIMQKTDFQFIAVIHDDASTDGTAEIIKEYERKYPAIIKGIYQKENQYKTNPEAIGNSIRPFLTGKYIAMCEGDDYWTDPLKLQKQVDILEKNPETGAVYSRVRCYYHNSGKFKECIGKNYISFKNLLLVNVIPTLTVMLRRELLLQYEQEVKPDTKKWKMGDYPMWLWLAKNSHLHFINEVTGVYRVLNESVSHSNCLDKHIEFYKSCKEIQEYFINEAHCYELKGWVEEYYNSRMYQLCLEYDRPEIVAYRSFFKNIKPTSLKNKLFKLSANNTYCEYILKKCFQCSVIRTLYHNLAR